MVHPERDDNRAGQRRHVDDHVGLESPRVVKRVAEDQAALGVGVEDLDGETGGAGDDVAGLDGPTVGHVFAGGDQADDVERQVELGHGVHGADDAGRAAHVEFHFVHGRRIFERDATGVEGDALADQHHGRAFGARVPMFDDDESAAALRCPG